MGVRHCTAQVCQWQGALISGSGELSNLILHFRNFDVAYGKLRRSSWSGGLTYAHYYRMMHFLVCAMIICFTLSVRAQLLLCVFIGYCMCVFMFRVSCSCVINDDEYETTITARTFSFRAVCNGDVSAADWEWVELTIMGSTIVFGGAAGARLRSNSGQVVHTYKPQPKQYNRSIQYNSRINIIV